LSSVYRPNKDLIADSDHSIACATRTSAAVISNELVNFRSECGETISIATSNDHE